ncbi:putative RsmD family RNA methyltransferase [Streptomyces sp. Tu6071]|nr:putative RsmD family RNA methyltransferase [Streptomyces sp. Tu6071]
MRRAAREGLQAHGAGAPVEVEDAFPAERAAEERLPGGEEALARPFGGGAGAGAWRYGKAAAPGRPGDHAGHGASRSSSLGPRRRPPR